MNNPYRALCAELDALLNDIASTHPNLSENGVRVVNDLSDRARALLAQPVAEGPTDDELMDTARATDLVYYMGKGCGFASPYQEGTDITAEVLAFARAVLARRGCLTPQPEPVALTDEEIMELMPQQMRDDLAAAARALAGFDRANVKTAGAFRIVLNRHAVNHARAVLSRYSHQ